LSIASIKIVATVVRDINFLRRKIGATLVASAIIDDTVGWTIIAITSGLALHDTLNIASLLQSLLETGLFLLASLTLGRRLVFGLIRWTNDTFVSEVLVVTAILIVMGLMSLATYALGSIPCSGLSWQASSDPHPSHRRAAARPGDCSVHADFLRPSGPQCGLIHPQ
jgi:Kef-type K+ transport system membrane component KefB